MYIEDSLFDFNVETAYFSRQNLKLFIFV